MTNQGLMGALQQYWTVEDKPRLTRRNTYFEDNFKVSNVVAMRVGIVGSVVAVAIIGFWSLAGVML